MKVALSTLLLAGLLTVAGCLTPGDDPTPPRGGTPEDGGAAGPTADPSGGAGWPPLSEALVRPGVQITFLTPPTGPLPLGGCTANFVFQEPGNASLFLGTAAHCLETLHVGDPVAIAGGAATGTLAYVSFHTLAERGEDSEESRRQNDFALVRIDNASRGTVHPGMLTFGGPIGVANASGLTRGDTLLLYGNSSLRQGVESANWREGCLAEATERNTRAYFLNPAIPADSGSPLLTASGEALGVVRSMNTGGPLEASGDKRVVSTLLINLGPALEFAKTAAGMDVVLATWPLLQGARLPAQPC